LHGFGGGPFWAGEILGGEEFAHSWAANDSAITQKQHRHPQMGATLPIITPKQHPHSQSGLEMPFPPPKCQIVLRLAWLIPFSMRKTFKVGKSRADFIENNSYFLIILQKI